MEQPPPYRPIDLPEDPHGLLAYVRRTPKVDVKNVSRVRLACGFDLARDIHTRIVQHDVDPAKRRRCLVKGRTDVVPVGDVQFDDEQLGGQVARRKIRQGLGFAEGGDDLVADLEKMLGHGATKARRGAGYCRV